MNKYSQYTYKIDTKMMKSYCDEHSMNMVELFSRFDADGSMSVTHEEFKLGLKVQNYLLE